MRFHVVTLFPELIESAAKTGIVGQAISQGKLELSTLSPRTFTSNVHHTVDDRPFGGGDGMIMMAEPLAQSVRQIKAALPGGARSKVIHLSPRGRKLDDPLVRELATFDDLILVASRYGGADQRFLNSEVDLEISIGDYVLSGGELAALVVLDAVGRLQPGVLGNEISSQAESFSGGYGLLEYPQFTRPREWGGTQVPEVLMSGDHAKIAAFQAGLSVLVTLKNRPDILDRALIGNPDKAGELVASGRKALNACSDAELSVSGLGSRTDLESALSEREIQYPPPRKKGRG